MRKSGTMNAQGTTPGLDSGDCRARTEANPCRWPAANVRLLALLLPLAGCPDEGAGLGSTTVTMTAADSSTATPDDGNDDNQPDDGNDDNQPDDGDDTTTDDGNDDTTVAGEGGGSSGSTGASSTGCMVGTQGCGCSEEAPACDKGLACVEDICVEPLCPMDDEDPANDIPQEAIDLGAFNDGGNGDTIISQLSGADDVDWWSYTCNDTLLEELDPARQITSVEPLRVCKYLDCVTGGNPTQFECPENATQEMIDFGFLEGCCVDDGSSFNIDYNCPDSDNDAVIVYVRVDEGPKDTCADYQIDFSC